MKEDLRRIVTIIDISKAFDTVPHRAISKELEIKRVPNLISEYIQNMYKIIIAGIR